MNNRVNTSLSLPQLEGEVITLLFDNLSTKAQIDNAVIARESVKVGGNVSSLSTIENLKAFNPDGSINEQNCRENNITFNLRMDVVGYKLPEHLSMREKIIFNAAMALSQQVFMEKYQALILELNTRTDALNEDGEALSDPNRSELFKELDGKLTLLITNLQTITGAVMKKMQDVRMVTPSSDTPSIEFLNNAFLVLILNESNNKFPDEYLHLLNVATRMFMEQINKFHSQTENNLIPLLTHFINRQIEIIERQLSDITHSHVRGQLDQGLVLIREALMTLRGILDTFRGKIGPLPRELNTADDVLAKLQLHDYLQDYIETTGLDVKYATINPDNNTKTLQNTINKLLAITAHKIHSDHTPKRGAAMVKRYRDLIDVEKDLDKLIPGRQAEESAEQVRLIETIQKLKASIHTQKSNIEADPEWQAMLFLTNAKEYISSPDRKWNITYQLKKHTIPGTDIKIPAHVADQLQEIEEAERTGKFQQHKEKFLEIGMKKASSRLSSGSSNTYFNLFKNDEGTAPEGEAAKREVEAKLESLFRRK